MLHIMYNTSLPRRTVFCFFPLSPSTSADVVPRSDGNTRLLHQLTTPLFFFAFHFSFFSFLVLRVLLHHFDHYIFPLFPAFFSPLLLQI